MMVIPGPAIVVEVALVGTDAGVDTGIVREGPCVGSVVDLGA